MERNTEIKYKTLGMRLLAAFTAIAAGMSYALHPSLKAMADSENVASVIEEYAAADEDAAYEYDLQDDDSQSFIQEDFPDVTAYSVPYSDVQKNEVIDSMRLSFEENIQYRSGLSGFIPNDNHAVAQKALKQFKYDYVFTSPEPYEDDTPNYIVRSDNFYIKGRITINTEQSLAAGHMEFRIPRYIFPERDGGYCEINSVAVMKFSRVPQKDSSGVYDVEGKWNKSVAPFNYFIDDETDEYVFVNYTELGSSSNMIEVSYSKVDVFDFADDTEWSIFPTSSIIYELDRTGCIVIDGEVIGGDNSYFTECDYNGSNVYMRGLEADTYGAELSAYYDIEGNALFVKKVYNGITEWYDVSGKKIAPASELIDGKTPISEAPVITVLKDTCKVESSSTSGLSGKIDTGVTLDSVTKAPESNNSKGYGSQLYTKGQMSKYINTAALPDEVLDGNNLSADYIYTCWKVYTKGKSTQPWSMLLEEVPKAAQFEENSDTLVKDSSGKVVYHNVDGALVLGVSTMMQNSKHYDSRLSSNSDDIIRLYSYVDESRISSDIADYGDLWYISDSNAGMRGTFGLQKVATEHKYDIGYYVVVAYPVSELDSYTTDDGTIKYPDLMNEVSIHLYSRDENIVMTRSGTSPASVTYTKFEWSGGENYWHTYKRAGVDSIDGFISVYDKLAEDTESGQEHIGNIMFHESYRGGAYNCCHSTTDYGHIDGKYYKVVNTDDILTAQPYGEIKEDESVKSVYGIPAVLDGEDYFYSRGVLTLSEFEIDPFEDITYALNKDAAAQKIYSADDTLNRDWIVYGWYEGGSDWEEIDLTEFGYPHSHFTVDDYVALKGSNSLAVLNLNFMDRGLRCPFRVKVEHNCIAYNTRMNWDLETQIKTDSPKFNRTNGILRKDLYYADGTKLPEDHGDLEIFRISLRNYSATKATAYDAKDPSYSLELIDHYNNNSNIYQNIEGLSGRTLVNANRYDFVGMDNIYVNVGTHIQKNDRTKSSLGQKLLGTDSSTQTLESPFGISEYIPLRYIGGKETYSDQDEFIEANSHVYRDYAVIDLSAIEENAQAEKFASWENDTTNGQVIMTYTLSGYEGYKLSKELRPLIESMNIAEQPVRNEILMYDLLPEGVNYYGYERPVAGKLTTVRIGEDSDDITYDDVESFVSSWDRSSDAVELVSVDTIPDWNNTGRTMVVFDVRFNDTSGILTDSNWFIGCGIRFKAYVSWDNYAPAREKDNIFAYTIKSGDINNDGNIYGRWTGKADSQVYDGAGKVVPVSNIKSADYSPFKNNTLDGTDTDKHNRLYAHANDMESITMARTLGIKKSVRADINKFADYENQTSVIRGQGYTYKIHIDKTAQGAAGNIIVFDNLEKISTIPGGVQGQFNGINCSEVKLNYDVTPEIWYSESFEAPTILYKGDDGYTLDPDAEGAERVKWDFDIVNSLLGDNTDADGKPLKWVKSLDNSKVRSIAVDFGELVLSEKAVLNLYINMTAPEVLSGDRFSVNRTSYYFVGFEKNSSLIGGYHETDSFDYSESNITVVTFGDENSLEVEKRIAADYPSEIVSDEGFSFRVISNISTYN